MRATVELDILAQIRDDQVAGLPAELRPDWYGDPKMIRDHLRAGRAFNLIHQTCGRKFDIFPAVQPFHASEVERATKIAI